MNKNLTRIVVIAVIIAAILGLSWLQARDSSDQASNDEEQSEQENKDKKDNKADEKSDENKDGDSANEQSSDSFSYTAQSGDSYTEMARKAVQQFSTDNKSDLSEAAIVYAETVLTQNASAPELNLGQTVEIKKTDVAVVVEKAKNLSSAQVAAWSQYVSSVNFDTSAVGGK